MVKKTRKKLNIYGKNIYNEKDIKLQLELSRLTNFLNDEEWLKLSTQKYKSFGFDKTLFKNKKFNMVDIKPDYVSWFSKGSWLFHEMCCDIDEEIIYITVDYKNIYKITNKNPDSNLSSNNQYKTQLNKFNKKYIYYKGKNKWVFKNATCNLADDKKECEKDVGCEWDKKNCNYIKCSKKSGVCRYYYTMPYYDWKNVFEKYDGMAIYPMMNYQEITSIQKHLGFYGWDVESLVLINDKPVIKHYNLGTIRELLQISKTNEESEKNNHTYEKNNINYHKLVSLLIKKIKKIRSNEL